MSVDKVFRDRLKNGQEGPEMVVIRAGSFRMGDVQGGGEPDELPARIVTIRKPFAIGRYEVTLTSTISLQGLRSVHCLRIGAGGEVAGR